MVTRKITREDADKFTSQLAERFVTETDSVNDFDRWFGYILAKLKDVGEIKLVLVDGSRPVGK